MPTLNIRADSSNAVTAANNYTTALQSVDDRLKDIVTTSAKVNAAGKVVSQTFKALTYDGDIVTGTLKEKAGVLELVGATYKRTDLAAKAHLATLKMQKSALDDIKRSINNVSSALQYYVAYRGFNMLTDGIRAGVTAAKDFQIELSLIRTLSQDAQQSFAKWGTDLKGVSDRTGTDLADVAKGAYDAISNQVAKGAAIAPFIEQAAEFARVTKSTVTDSVNLFSSAINAYGMSTAEAERIAAVFFKTIDEGRVVTAEMANTYGRVAVLGKGLGVSFEEINAMLAIMTKQGLKTDDAMTLMTNLMIKLEKPTEATSKLFKSWGVESGEAAVKTFTAAGVIRKIIEEVAKGNQEFSVLFDEIRGRKGIGALANDLEGFETFVGKLQNTTEVIKTFREAQKIRGESPADQLTKEFNKLKNAFTVNLGQDLLKLTLQFVEFAKVIDKLTGGTGELVSSGNKLIVMFAAGVIGLVAFRTAMGLAAMTTNSATIALLRNGQAMAAAKVAASGLMATLPGLIATMAAFALSSAFLPTNIIGDRSAAADEIAERAEKAREDQLKRAASGGGPDSMAQLNKAITDSFTAALKAVAEQSKKTGTALDEVKARGETATSALKAGFAAYTDGIKTAISNIRKAISEADAEIKKSQASMLSFKQTLDGLAFGTKMKYATDEQKIALTNDKIKELTSKAKGLFTTGNKADAEEARRLLDQAASLTQQNFERQEDLRIDKIKDAVSKGLISGPLNSDGKLVIPVDTTKLERDLEAINKQKIQGEEAYQALQLRTLGNSQMQLKTEQERLRNLDQALKDFEKLDFLKPDGSISDKYVKKGTNKPDFDKLIGDFNAKSDAILATAPDYQTRLQLEALLFDKRRALYDQIKLLEQKGNEETYRKKLLLDQESTKKSFEEIKSERLKAENDTKNGIKTLGDQLENFRAAKGALQGARPRPFGVFQDVAGADWLSKKANDQSAAYDKLLQDLDGQIQQYDQAVANLKANQRVVGGAMVARPEDVTLVQDQVRAVLDLIDKATAFTQGPGKTLMIKGQQKNTSALELQQELPKILEDLLKAGGLALSADAKQSVLKDSVKTPEQQLEEMKKLLPDVAGQATATGASVTESFGRMGTSIDDVNKKLEQMQLNMQMVGPNAKVNAVVGGEASYFADGGVVGFPGQPRGADRYPVWAAKDEFIVNANSSRAFRPMLEAINNNRRPSFMAEGGVVGMGDTIVGDINVTVQGGSSPQQTGRAIGQTLEREIRKRTITFTPQRRR